jgi:DNA-directed RNA polymerase specialized sigma24 family protein
MSYKEEEQVKSLIARYQQSIFALVLYLIGGEQDEAYNVCAESFVEAIRSAPPLEQEGDFFSRLAGIAVAQSREVKMIPAFSCLDMLEVPDIERGPLRIVLIALLGLDFDTKAAVLLRDQLCFSYKEIGAIMGTSESNARHLTIQARINLRRKVEEIINNAERDKN